MALLPILAAFFVQPVQPPEISITAAITDNFSVSILAAQVAVAVAALVFKDPAWDFIKLNIILLANDNTGL